MPKPKATKVTKAQATPTTARVRRRKILSKLNYCLYCTKKIPRGPRKFCNKECALKFGAMP